MNQSQHQTISAIENALRETGALEFSGDVQLLEWSKSTSRDGPKVKLLLPDDESVIPFEAATIRKGRQAGQLYHIFAVRIDEEPASSAEMVKHVLAEVDSQLKTTVYVGEKPYGHYARALYISGFFNSHKVLEAVGTDEQYQAWCRKQPCAKTGVNPGESPSNPIEYAHVRRVANGAGTAEKPPYSGIPLCHYWHQLQSQHGESVFASKASEFNQHDRERAEKGKTWMDNKRVHYLSRWMADTVFECESMGYVPPDQLLEWCADNEILMALPAVYK